MRWLLSCLMLGCSAAPAPNPEPIAATPKPVACTDHRLGGYTGSPECAATANTRIPAADRSCTTSADCIRLGPHCSPFAIRNDRTDAYASSPCLDPEQGQCPPPCAAVCRDGCCVIPVGWGDNCR